MIASCSYEARRFGLQAGDATGPRPPPVPTGGRAARTCRYLSGVHDRVRGARRAGLAVDRYLDDAYLDLLRTDRLYPIARSPSSSGAGCAPRAGSRSRSGSGPTHDRSPAGARSRMGCGSCRRRRSGVRARSPARRSAGIGLGMAEVLESIGPVTVADAAALGADQLARLGPQGRVSSTSAPPARHASGERTRAPRPRSPAPPASIHQRSSRQRSRAIWRIWSSAPRARRAGSDSSRAVSRSRSSPPTAGARAPPGAGRTDGAFDPVLLESAARSLLARATERRVGLRRLGIEPARGGSRRAADPPRSGDRDLLAACPRHRPGAGPLRHAALMGGRTFPLAATVARDRHGFVLRTPSLTK